MFAEATKEALKCTFDNLGEYVPLKDELKNTTNMPSTNYLETTESLNSSRMDKGKVTELVSLFAGIGRKNKSITFAGVKYTNLQSYVICISADSDCEEITPKKVRKVGVKQIDRPFVFHDSFFKIKSKP